jgi:prepilin-type processing-associated H-X9-DG protein
MIPVEEFICPSRRRVRAYPYLKTATDAYINIETPSVVGRSDYAANAGDATGRDPQLRTVNTADLSTTWRGPLTLADADSRPDDYWGNSPGGYMNATGVIFRRSWVSMGHLLRSPSCIYLLGERYVHHERYTDGTDPCDDQGWDVGYECDTNRFTAYPPKRDSDRTVAAAVGGTLFGSAHTTGFHMAFCDGSVRRISFNIDPDIHRRLGNRKDTADIDVSTLP